MFNKHSLVPGVDTRWQRLHFHRLRWLNRSKAKGSLNYRWENTPRDRWHQHLYLRLECCGIWWCRWQMTKQRQKKNKRINVEQKCVSIIVCLWGELKRKNSDVDVEKRNMFRYLLWFFVGNAILLVFKFLCIWNEKKNVFRFSCAQSSRFTSFYGMSF